MSALLRPLCLGRIVDGGPVEILPLVAPPDDPDMWVVAVTWQAGWRAYFDMLPPGAVIRSNEAMVGWLAAREDAAAVDVDYD